MNTLCNKAQQAFSALLFTLILTILLSFQTVSAQPDGAKLFKQNCATCHKLDDTRLTGPGLKDVFKRIPDDEWFLKWVKSNTKLTASGDPYAVKISAFDVSTMNEFGFLADDEINAIGTFLKNPPAPVVGPTGPTGPTGEVHVEKGLDTFWTLVIIIIALIIIIAVLRGVKRSLSNVVNEREGKPANPDRNVWEETKVWMGANKSKVALIIIILLSIGSKMAWDAMFDIGVFTGYKPSQPIAFSHKIHAGDNAINCVYCHSTAEKSRHAGIPSTNICMNCHKGISSGATTGTTEIAKIYEAVGWDPKQMAYNMPQKPIKWNKVHNLPDFVYFSHQQHVVVGKQECQTCHGDVPNMTVAEQVSPLTMRWCIDCHRETEVPGMMANADSTLANPYYEDLHKKLAEKYKGQKITVDKMGGIECAKCHY